MPAPPQWSFVLTDLQGVVIGEILNADSRTVTLQHKGIPTAGFTLPLWHPLAGNILDVSTDTLLKCYRRDSVSNKLVFCGPISSVQEAGDSLTQTISVSAAGPFSRLTKRFIGQSKSGISFGTAGSLIDLGLIAHNILDIVNADEYTGIAKGTRTASVSGAVGPWYLKNAAEAIAELSVGLNSFDFVVDPTEPTNIAGAWPQIGTLRIAPIIGVNRNDAIFEYGTTRANVASYSRQITRDQLINRAIISVSGWPDGTTKDLIFRQDTTSRTARGLYEDVVNDAGVEDDGLRTQIADEHILWRKQPKQVVTFTPSVNASPTAFRDFDLSDWVRARAVVRGSVRFDAMFRIWGMGFSIDQNGNESLDLTLVQE